MLCAMNTNQLKPSSTNKMIATTIQPRLLRGLDGGGAVMIGGDFSGGGASPEEKFISIAGESYSRIRRGARRSCGRTTLK